MTSRHATCARNRAHAQLLVGIYFDAASSSSPAGSLTAYDAARPFFHKSLRFADLLERVVLDAMNSHGWQIPNIGVENDTTLGSYVQPAPGSDSAYARRRLGLQPPALARSADDGLFHDSERDAGRARSSRCSSPIRSRPRSLRARLVSTSSHRGSRTPSRSTSEPERTGASRRVRRTRTRSSS